MNSHKESDINIQVSRISSSAQSSFLPGKRRKKNPETKFANGYCKVIEAINSTLRAQPVSAPIWPERERERTRDEYCRADVDDVVVVGRRWW